MSWREKLRDLPTEVLVQLLVMAISALLVKAYPVSKIWLSNTAHACHQAASKIYSAFRQPSFLAGAKRKIANFVAIVAAGIFKLAYYCFWIGYIYCGISSIGSHVRTSSANSDAVAQSSTCYCPTPTDNVYSGTIEPEWQTSVSPRNCIQRYDIHPHYPAQSVFYATKRKPISDCSPARKGSRGKRAGKPCTTVYLPTSVAIDGRSHSDYSIDDEPR
jgi:hypothetical protein